MARWLRSGCGRWTSLADFDMRGERRSSPHCAQWDGFDPGECFATEQNQGDEDGGIDRHELHRLIDWLATALAKQVRENEALSHHQQELREAKVKCMLEAERADQGTAAVYELKQQLQGVKLHGKKNRLP